MQITKTKKTRHVHVWILIKLKNKILQLVGRKG